jgi:hypothetical protein
MSLARLKVQTFLSELTKNVITELTADSRSVSSISAKRKNRIVLASKKPGSRTGDADSRKKTGTKKARAAVSLR